jgi:hypothetical protein
MDQLAELGVWKWLLEHVAIPMLGGMWGALAWWVKMIADKFERVESQHKSDLVSLQQRLTTMDHDIAETYARRDDVKEGFAQLRNEQRDGFAAVERKLDRLVDHALKGREG